MTDGTARRTRRLRVALLAPSLAAGGAERQMLLVARELRHSHDIRFFAMRSGGLFTEAARDLGIEVHTLGWSQRTWQEAPVAYAAGVVRAFVAYLRLSRRVDVVDAWLTSAYALAGLAQPLARVPVLIAGRRAMSDMILTVGPLRRGVASLAMRHVDAVVANSQAVARDAITQEGIREDRVRVIRNGIDPPAESAAEERSRWRGSWGIPDDSLVVGSVANYLPRKGVEAVVEVAHRLRGKRPDLRYVLVGEGPVRPMLERRIAELGLADIVTLYGSHPNAHELYPAFDIIVHASESEGLPNVILEAAAWGRPIVATDVGGTREVVRDRHEALLVPARDPAALAVALLELVEDAGLRDRLAAAARVRSLEFSAERLAADTAQLYAALFATRRRRK